MINAKQAFLDVLILMQKRNLNVNHILVELEKRIEAASQNLKFTLEAGPFLAEEGELLSILLELKGFSAYTRAGATNGPGNGPQVCWLEISWRFKPVPSRVADHANFIEKLFLKKE